MPRPAPRLAPVTMATRSFKGRGEVVMAMDRPSSTGCKLRRAALHHGRWSGLRELLRRKRPRHARGIRPACVAESLACRAAAPGVAQVRHLDQRGDECTAALVVGDV